VALISVISFLSVMLAVAALIIVMSVMNGFRGDLLGRLLGAQGHVFVHAAEGALVDREATLALAERLAATPGVVRAAPMIKGEAGARSENAFSGVEIYGLARKDLETLTIPDGIIAGGIEGFGDSERDGDVILIGDQLADALGVWVGNPVWLISPSCDSAGQCTPKERTYYVGGVFAVGMPEVDALFVYLPIEEARSFLGRDPSLVADSIEVSVADPEEIDAAVSTVKAVVGGGYTVKDWTTNYESYVTALKVERNAMRLILALLVLIAALNIISGLVMLAKNKVADIAILRTVGASQGSVMRIFFLIGATIGVLGTTAGLILGVLFSANIGAIQDFAGLLDVSFLAQIPARIEWREVFFIALWGLAASCMATVPPAWNAARHDPVEALRYG
jgi:lipoprotein-releasing system permease protein